MKLIQVSIQNNGVYFTYKLPVSRGIRGKTKNKVNELLIQGIPIKRVQDYCLKEKLIITNKAIYANNDMEQPILFRKDNTFTYVEETNEK